ncbi:DNA-directed RNA polymerase alpha subunit [Flavobacterium nitrogenifigens]|uniref:DNA-directed RNA polymerase alpha subunit n=2 Tax=Flavobacterium TaxID=237 RepID=A0A7W7J0Z3_9FLAO|nr:MULTISPECIES: RNA polymerase alpha subunit C-terminal domain-containing protein [Flavobacterium]MBB4804100.1 DNA-directed RNA polymerase alpha subunit [Flavobacterium nitrogenifigens]MBB6389059.1 DNA-directed RNA polymerase alpha subunit [Flavobacterium notoginsengisoli]
MKEVSKNNRTCKNGHNYFKTSDCPTCPICEAERKPNSGFLSVLSAPARRALESKNIKTAKDLSQYTQKEIMSLHGIGPSSLPKLLGELKKYGLMFKD